MKVLAKILGGSHLYGLANDQSDLDYRGIFCNTDLSKILGLDRFDCENKLTNEVDLLLFEIRHFLSLLRKTNTQVLEILFAPENKFVELDNDFKILVLGHKYKFLDTKKFFKSIMGYLYSERRLVNGERKGQIGKKRYESVKRYSYSPKNYANYLRLCLVAEEFFKTQNYVVDCKEFKEYDLLREIRENPSNFSREDINADMDKYERLVKQSFDNRDKTKDLTFDEGYANFVLWSIYKQYL